MFEPIIVFSLIVIYQFGNSKPNCTPFNIEFKHFNHMNICLSMILIDKEMIIFFVEYVDFLEN